MSKHKFGGAATHHKNDRQHGPHEDQSKTAHPQEPPRVHPPEHLPDGDGQTAPAAAETPASAMPPQRPGTEHPGPARPGKEHPAPAAAGVSPQDEMSGCLVRVLWMLVANAALLVCLKFIQSNHGSLLSWADAIFWAVAALGVGLRYVDVKKLQGRTATGKPATLSDWRRYSLILLGICAVAWLAAHAWAHWARSVH